ncbi:DNA-processing protein DprA [Caulobacter sp. NIBR2454]|uniref:DNA-processing protein DprA n=1 Tax=Caulobacter sp. NIBR2454 TaxID=3015996 RepID=UPI0022B618CE|nr:DNA-processing protein DprA [Caulobacter sp. NIBR2454]
MTAGPLSDRERIAWLRLSRTENVGPVTFEQLVTRFGSASAALAALPDLARRGGRIDPLTIPTQAQAEDEFAAGHKLGARLLAACEPEFPRHLAALDPPPPLIWALGQVNLLNRPSIAIVGARIASAAGQRFARGLAVDLGKAGHVVVSGLARGIDGAAHEGALSSGTIAVLGGGIDDIYPPEHADLHARIAAEGCIVSESRPGQRAQAKDFPRRNRIISGLSLGVVVVEAELKSGSLITARLAAEQGREVFAVPGSPLDPRAKGTNDLIRQGAALCEGVDDILRALEGVRSLEESEPPPYAAHPRDQAALDRAADRLRDRVEAMLSPTEVSRDELIRAVGEPAPVVLAALVELVLAGRAAISAEGMVSRR